MPGDVQDRYLLPEDRVAKSGAKTQTAARLVEGVATEQAQETAIAASPGASGGLPQRRTLLSLVESIVPMMLCDNVCN